ncbi:MAG: ABC transporter permease [Peptococcales bacterium]|jgi:putative ABC transport system permease protein
MYKIDIFKMAYKNLWRRKVRTFLTVLGVLIGTTSIIVMISLGIGLNESQRRNMEQWGSLNQIEIYSGMNFDEEGNPIGQANPLNDDAVNEIKALPGVTAVSPGFNMGGRALWGRKEGYLNIVGIDPAEMPQFEFETAEGRLLDGEDRFNIVLGWEVGQNFRDRREMEMMRSGRGGGRVMMNAMGGQDSKTLEMMNQRISMEINNRNGQKKVYNFTVVGVLSDKARDKSWQAYGPIEEIKRIREFMMGGARSGGDPRMAMEMGIRGGSRVSNSRSSRDQGPSPDDYEFIWVRTKDVDATKEVSKILKERGYQSYSMADSLEGIEKTSKTIQAILGGIGSITLLVAALGIINTMIMSIYERTKEIGIMKVIGASFFDIRMLFLTEAGLIGLMGGIFGLGISYGTSKVINHFASGFINQGMPPGDMANSLSVIPPWLALFALGFSILIGVVAGLYPANRAVRLSPISAIRNE